MKTQILLLLSILATPLGVFGQLHFNPFAEIPAGERSPEIGKKPDKIEKRVLKFDNLQADSARPEEAAAVGSRAAAIQRGDLLLKQGNIAGPADAHRIALHQSLSHSPRTDQTAADSVAASKLLLKAAEAAKKAGNFRLAKEICQSALISINAGQRFALNPPQAAKPQPPPLPLPPQVPMPAPVPVPVVMIETRTELPSTNATFPFVTIAVGPDLTITRTVAGSESAQNLTWNILRNGTMLLGRNAKNETSYKYYDHRPGLYTVYMTAFIDGAYRVISNVIFYEVKAGTGPAPAPGAR